MEVLLAGLKSLLEMKVDCHEVVLVDNGSTDSTFSIIRSALEKFDLDKRVHLIRLGRNLGFSRANNVAYYAINKEFGPFDYVMPVNNDAIVLSEPVKFSLELLSELEEVGGIQGLLVNENGLDSGPMEWAYTSLPSRPVLSWNYVETLAMYPQLVPFLDGAVSIFKSEAIERVGFFDPDTFMYGDDYVLGAKLWTAGYLLLFVPLVFGYHKRGATLSRRSELFSYWNAYYNSCAGIKYSEGSFRLWNYLGLLWTSVKSIAAYLVEGKRRHLGWARGRIAALAECPELRPGEFPGWPVLVDDNLISSIIGETVSIVHRNVAVEESLRKLLSTLEGLFRKAVP